MSTAETILTLSPFSAPITSNKFYQDFFAHNITIAPGDSLEVKLGGLNVSKSAIGEKFIEITPVGIDNELTKIVNYSKTLGGTFIQEIPGEFTTILLDDITYLINHKSKSD